MNWRKLIQSLPKGLTFREAATRLGQDYNQTRLAIHRYRYRAVDGRAFSQVARRKIKAGASINWLLPNIEIARKLGVSRERVRQLRLAAGKPMIESRGRKPKK